jgi:hypothetical protein
MFSVSSAWPAGVSVTFEMVPMSLPEASTRSPLTIWLALTKIAWTF